MLIQKIVNYPFKSRADIESVGGNSGAESLKPASVVDRGPLPEAPRAQAHPPSP